MTRLVLETSPGTGWLRAGVFGAVCLFAGLVGAGELTVRGGDLVRIGRFDWIAPGVVPVAPDPALPLIDPGVTDPAAMLLRRLHAKGAAAGFHGLVYDNRDAGHSTLPAALFPQLTRLAYSEELDRANLDYGLGGQIILPVIVFGNSSTARTGGFAPRSLPRIAMTEGGWAHRAFRTYVSNHIFVYPEHRDHDDVDLFPTNWPYMITSQGSSGSDQVFLRAIAMTLAAFSPETRRALQEGGLIAPALQMILRRSLKNVTSREIYLSGVAHPTAFDGHLLSAERMVTLAADLRAEDIPPMVRLSVVDEDFALSAGLGGMSERLFDTPSAIARVWRRLEGRSRMIVSAEDTRDPNGRDLSFAWILLRGDPGKVRIETLDAAGQTARITIEWQEPRPTGEGLAGGALRSSARVDIGVFAWNGVHDSAPAFVSVQLPTHQNRTYRSQPDGDLLLISVDYDAVGRGTEYDPLLFWSAAWRDEFLHDETGTMIGWRRRTGAGIKRYDVTGRRAGGIMPVSYRRIGTQTRWPRLEVVPFDDSPGER